MNLPHYTLQTDKTHSIYLFESIGVKGIIQKAILFEPTETDTTYNLSLCDLNPLSGKMDFSAISDNGDTQKILATIYFAIFEFTKEHPQSNVIFFGNSTARNRLYRMAINHELKEISKTFDILGLWNDSWIPFVPNKNYNAFWISRK
ncbi:DUF6934 family protein [Runella salmonicolor]|uniref:DUF695 domain-containing protein n=1 Tax=Runella salmonicolor TaxID=2950278 RepID=A0ABT1FJ33_9BACT|nr:hypothetical protein [Runella salmonicolor]MCP1381775.1 hypothetical protein [Runella salmonicolor]